MKLSKKWPEMVVQLPTPSIVRFVSDQSLENVLKYSAILGMYLTKTPHRVKDRCFFSNPPSHPQSRLTSTRARVFTIVWHLELKFPLKASEHV